MAPATAEIEDLRQREEWLRKIRGSLLVVAVLVASVTYQAGLNPPGGFWQDDMATFPTGGATTYIRGEGHFAGDPILRDKNFNRYATYMAFNTVAFVQALCIIVVLMLESRPTTVSVKLRLYVLRVFVIIHVTAMGIAYSLGTTRDSYDIYYSGLVMVILVVFVAATSFGVHYHYKKKEEAKHLPGATAGHGGGGDAGQYRC